MDSATGLWQHRESGGEPPLSLGDVTCGAEGLIYERRKRQATEDDLEGYFDEACEIVRNARPGSLPSEEMFRGNPDFEHLRWFPLPGELSSRLATGSEDRCGESPESTIVEG